MSPADQPQSDSQVSIAPGVWIVRPDLRFKFSRSSGPGGQAVNKVSTRAQLRVRIADIRGLADDAAERLRKSAGRRLIEGDEILIEAETYRSQLDNKQACLDRLRAMIEAALVKPKVRKKKRPTRGMIERRLQTKRRSSEKKGQRRQRRWRGGDDA